FEGGRYAANVSRSVAETASTWSARFSSRRSNFSIAWNSRRETSFHSSLVATSKCRFQIIASTLWVKITLGAGISQGRIAAGRRKSQITTSYDCPFTSSRSLSRTTGRQYFQTEEG